MGTFLPNVISGAKGQPQNHINHWDHETSFFIWYALYRNQIPFSLQSNNSVINGKNHDITL